MTNSPTSSTLQAALVATPRNPDRATFGPAAVGIGRALGYELDGFQREVLDVALEVDDDGRPWYRFVRMALGRQEGKTLLGLIVMLDRLLVGARRGWGSRQRALYGAQTGRMARAKLLDTWEPTITASPVLGPSLTDTVRSNGDEALRFGDAMVSVIPTSRKAGHGGTNHLVMLDEVFAHTTDDVIKGTRPTMLTVPGAQEWALSAAGDTPEESPVWWAMLEDIRARQASGAWGRTCGFEWGAGHDEDRADPATWARAMPAFLEGRIPEEVIRAELDACRTPLDFAGFDRTLLNRWGGGVSRLIPELAWLACGAGDAQAVGELELAVDVCPGHDGTPRFGHIVAAGRGADGVPVLELIDSRPGTSWIVDRVAELDERHAVWGWTIDAVGPVRALKAELELTVGAKRLHVATTQEACAAAERLHTAILEGHVRHRMQTVLDTAVAMAAKREVGDGQWCWGRRRSSGDVAPLVAGGLAHLRLLARPAGPLTLRKA